MTVKVSVAIHPGEHIAEELEGHGLIATKVADRSWQPLLVARGLSVDTGHPLTTQAPR